MRYIYIDIHTHTHIYNVNQIKTTNNAVGGLVFFVVNLVMHV